MFRKFFMFSDPSLVGFGGLIRRGFRAIQKNIIDSLYKPFLEVTIIPFSTFSYNLKILQGQERKTTNI